jgi:cephalosporin hydroxylase
MSLALLVRAPFRRRSYVVLWKRLRTYPGLWTRAFRDADFRLARAAEKRDALQKVREIAALIRLLRSRTLDTVVEIGSDRGGSFYVWCNLAEPDATLVSIDLPQSRGSVSRLRSYGLPGQRLYFIRGDSHDVATRDELARILGDRRIDFLMIDGDHTYEGVKRDFELYSPLVAAKGCIAFHDIVPHTFDPTCKVDLFWRDVKQAYEHVEFVDPYDDRGLGQWGGIGVLFIADPRTDRRPLEGALSRSD